MGTIKVRQQREAFGPDGKSKAWYFMATPFDIHHDDWTHWMDNTQIKCKELHPFLSSPCFIVVFLHPSISRTAIAVFHEGSQRCCSCSWAQLRTLQFFLERVIRKNKDSYYGTPAVGRQNLKESTRQDFVAKSKLKLAAWTTGFSSVSESMQKQKSHSKPKWKTD